MQLSCSMLCALCVLFMAAESQTPSESTGHAICTYGCQLLFHTQFSSYCSSHTSYAFVPNSYLSSVDAIDITSIIDHNQFICYDALGDSYSVSAALGEGTETVYTYSTPHRFTLNAPVVIWQSIIISIIVPIVIVLLVKLLLMVSNRCMEWCSAHPQCARCLYCCSPQYRSQMRNHKFQHANASAYNNIPSAAAAAADDDDGDGSVGGCCKWCICGKNAAAAAHHDERQQRHRHNDVGVAAIGMNMDMNEEEQFQLVLKQSKLEHDQNLQSHNPLLVSAPPEAATAVAAPPVLEEVCMNNQEVKKYLQSSEQQDIELSFSSHGLRAICDREVV